MAQTLIPEYVVCEDLKAFERRLTEVISYMRPASTRWRVILIVTIICTVYGAYQWLCDPQLKELSLTESLHVHLFFTISFVLLVLLFMLGIHKRVVAPTLIASRCRQVLAEFNMSCDDMTTNPTVNLTTDIPLGAVGAKVVLAIASTFIVFGGAVPYYFQYREVLRTQTAKGFSLYVCLALLLANVLRIMFWVGKRFELQLLLQSVVMIVCMFVMIEVVVRTNKKQLLPLHKQYSAWDGDWIDHFWQWSDFTSYLVFMLFFTTLISILTLLCLESRLYIESLGFLALFVEALLGLPQFYNNWKRKSTVGMSVKMILMWTTGDVGKTIYFFVRHTPPQFWLCGLLQVGVDISILLQVTYYRSAGKRQHDRDALS